jgi:hypothetical protein
MKMWHIFEEVNGMISPLMMETCYERGDAGASDLHQALDAYERAGRTPVHVLELEVWLKDGLPVQVTRWRQ